MLKNIILGLLIIVSSSTLWSMEEKQPEKSACDKENPHKVAAPSKKKENGADNETSTQLLEPIQEADLERAKIDQTEKSSYEPLHFNGREWLMQHGYTVEDGNGHQPIDRAPYKGPVNLPHWDSDDSGASNAYYNLGREAIHETVNNWRNSLRRVIESESTSNGHDNFGRGTIQWVSNTRPVHSSQLWSLAWGQNRYQSLHEAAQKGNVNDLELLIQQGAPVNARDDCGREPIHFAAENGHVNVLELLNRYGASSNTPDYTGIEPIHLACEQGHIGVLEWLIKHGANVNVGDEGGYKPLEGATENAQINTLEWLMEHGATMSSECMELAVGQRAINSVLWLLEHGVTPELTHNELKMFVSHELVYAVLKNEQEKAKKLLATWIHEEEEARKLSATWIHENAYTKQFNHALLVVIALHQDSLFDWIFKNIQTKITPELMRFALETAAASDNIYVFTKLYNEFRSSVHTQKIIQKDLLKLLEKVVYWAAIAGGQKVVSFILERAIPYGDAPNITIEKSIKKVRELLETYTSLAEDERGYFLTPEKVSALEGILDNLTNAAAIQEETALHSRYSSQQEVPAELQSLMDNYRWLGQFPGEIAVYIMSFMLDSKLTQ